MFLFIHVHGIWSSFCGHKFRWIIIKNSYINYLFFCGKKYCILLFQNVTNDRSWWLFSHRGINEKELFGRENEFFTITYSFWKLVVKKTVKMLNELIILPTFINKINAHISWQWKLIMKESIQSFKWRVNCKSRRRIDIDLTFN